MFHHLEKGEELKKAAKSAIENALTIWNELKVETKRPDNCEQRLLKDYNEWHYLSTNHKKHETQSDRMKKRIAEFTDRLNKVFDLKLERTCEEPSQEMDISEVKAEIAYEMTIDVEMEQVEEQPGTSGQSESKVRKRSSALEAERKTKDIFGKSSKSDEEGMENRQLFAKQSDYS